jgi:hypothetical protein
MALLTFPALRMTAGRFFSTPNKIERCMISRHAPLVITQASCSLLIFFGLPGFVWVAFTVSNSACVTILLFFCTPVHSSAQGMIAGTDNKPFRASQRFPSPGERTRPRLPGFVTASVFSTFPCLCVNLFMGCRGFWKVKDFCHSPAPGSSDARDTRAWQWFFAS